MRRKERCSLGYFFIGFVLLILFNLHEQTENNIPAFSGKSSTISEDLVTFDTAPMIALTFDDGPHPIYTKMLLDGLKKRGVKATFFVVGENIPGNEDLIREMEKDGHLICNHTYDHCNLTCLSVEDAWEELAKTSGLVQDITGKATSYVRPPYGKWKEELDEQISMIEISWTLDTLDWSTRNAADVVKKVMTNVKENDIILLHDYYQTSIEAALQIVDGLLEKGYRFVTVEDLILE